MAFVFKIFEGFNFIHHDVMGAVIFSLVGCIDCWVLFAFWFGSQLYCKFPNFWTVCLHSDKKDWACFWWFRFNGRFKYLGLMHWICMRKKTRFYLFFLFYFFWVFYYIYIDGFQFYIENCNSRSKSGFVLVQFWIQRVSVCLFYFISMFHSFIHLFACFTEKFWFWSTGQLTN